MSMSLVAQFSRYIDEGSAVSNYLALTEKGKKVLGEELKDLCQKASTPEYKYKKERILYFKILEFFNNFPGKKSIKKILKKEVRGNWKIYEVLLSCGHTANEVSYGRKKLRDYSYCYSCKSRLTLLAQDGGDSAA